MSWKPGVTDEFITPDHSTNKHRKFQYSNKPLYSNTVISTLAIDGWAATFGTARRAWVGCSPAQSPPR